MKKSAFLIGPSAAVEGATPGSERPIRAVTVIHARGDHGVDKKETLGMQS